jgi:ADP-dependent NAD(P)H-hydrate dehydratase
MIRVTAIPKLPPRELDSHKGTYGRVLVIAGSVGMSGAAILTGSAALRSGAGLVTVACPLEVQPVVAMGNPCYTTYGFRYGHKGVEDLIGLGEKCDVVAIGPGLRVRPEVAELVRLLVLALPRTPFVVDADGLTNLMPIPDAIRSRVAPLVMTPHPGEFARLLGKSTTDVQANRESLAVEFARQYNLVLLLKGHRTVVTDGERVYLNETGNPGMATGGSGDVLTGLIAAVIAQKMPAFEAACFGAWVHGRAGDIAAERVGQTSLIATDLLDQLPRAINKACGS